MSRPDRLVEPDAWVGHIPFAFWIVAAHRPRTLVELGTHSGNSYGAFCQAVASLGLETACYAVDTWEGDPQAGFYGAEVFDDLRRYHDPRYGAFSRLVRATFDDAVGHFADGCVDLLHIDGYHTYDAVRHDFETWRPKLSRRALVLFHDINVREGDFGAWRLWQEIAAGGPGFAFHHSHGLGVLAAGDELSPEVRALIDASAGRAVVLRRWFAAAGQSLLGELSAKRLQQLERHRDQLETALHATMAERDATAAQIEKRERELNEQLQRAAAEQQRADADRQRATAAEQEQALVQIQNLHADRAALLDARTFLQRQVTKERRRRRRLRSTLTWRATKPLRAAEAAVRKLIRGKHKPRDQEAKPKPADTPTAPTLALQPAPTVPTQAAVPLIETNPLTNPVARVIAFYLPQFHPIPDNDRWWGKGFTEWTNVSKAQPLFEGHYQPHLPGELGFYDLRLLEVQRRQVELAKVYGVTAFCFYFYWFSGRRLLERPLQQWLEHPELELEFCLCWANENWTRRWDGKESEILIGQNHSPEDDLAFIAEVAPYLRDPRYLRVEGRPLLLVYRPALLPDAAATARRWRDWCRDNGIGEIVLAYTQSFETDPPDLYGFDLAVEFPPNETRPREVTSSVVPLRPESFRGRIYDWTSVAEREPEPGGRPYPLARGVCPSWDNTARRGEAGTVLLNAEPRLFRDWVEHAAIQACLRAGAPDRDLLFVNAWNEWAEGAHLEPDRRYGYAHLEAVRQGLRLASARLAPAISESATTAVVVHAFYPEILDEILPRLSEVGLARHLYLSCTEHAAEAVAAALAKHGITGAEIVAVPNRGRDVAPFLKIVARIQTAGHALVLKLHTKRSRHRQDGDSWREQIYGQLLSPEGSATSQSTLRRGDGFGVIGPEGSVVSMTWYRGSNIARVQDLAARMGVASLDERHDCFVAGTMFYARIDALRPLLELDLALDDFEPECGQVDGTLAHAVERAVSYSALAAGFRVGEMRRRNGGVACEAPDPSAATFHFAEVSA
ncbi:MAG: glycoside hydrolase family 99-like domain-containing protein [Geminicoccaceae bacterium]